MRPAMHLSCHLACACSSASALSNVMTARPAGSTRLRGPFFGTSTCTYKHMLGRKRSEGGVDSDQANRQIAGNRVDSICYCLACMCKLRLHPQMLCAASPAILT